MAPVTGADSTTTDPPDAGGSDGDEGDDFPTTLVGATPEPAGQRVDVIDVLDGDSLAVDIDGTRTEVRIFGINTPEKDECYGSEAREALDELVGSSVVLATVEGAADTDQFGRLLRNVWSDGVWVDAVMVRAGAALPLHTGGPDEADLLQLSADAWTDGLGMWGIDVCGTAPTGILIEEVAADPKGRDEEALDEEYVVLRNDTDDTVDMSGWILRDESSTHRLTFPDGTTLGPGETVRIVTGCNGDIAWCSDTPIWSNGGDTAILQIPTGSVVDRFPYS